MDEQFATITRRAAAKGIQDQLIFRLEDLLQAVRASNFENDFYAGVDNPTVAKLADFHTFYAQVVIQGWTFMNQEADTPQEINDAFAYLTSKGVGFGG